MARFVFVTWSGAGNQTPAIGLAATLADRGHEVTFAGYDEQRDRFSSLGFAFRTLKHAQEHWPTAPPPDWMPILADVVWASGQHLRDIPDLLAAEHYDVMVIDCLMFAALAAAERASAPTAVLVHSAPGALVPPGGGLDQLALDRVNEVRTESGLSAVQTLWETWQGFPVVCTSAPDLDPPAHPTPAAVEYMGPVFEPRRGAPWIHPWGARDQRPLVLVSFSTGPAWDQTSRISRTLTALSPDCHRVLVTAGMADISQVPVRGDAVLTPFVAHADVLPHASVTVTHAGHGTVIASLAHGVPLVALPNPAADQPALAEQIERLGVGIALEGDTATPDQIAAAVHTLLNDDSYARNARRLAHTISALPGPNGAAAVLERIAGSA
ncbi:MULTISPECIES: glycosyltransferase [unclassified Streptomyces]|uniref:glycosyltransferase n=1 Tax=unclassified Streptomyces TaxID=2593676 RepID=UPI000FFF1493|nr:MULTISPECIES: glycosyltransferase [unclassified Streptomyces]